MRKLTLFVATGAGSGFSPLAPGTAGSLVGLLLYLPLTGSHPLTYVGLVAGVFVLGVWTAGRAERVFGQRDDRRITIDEIAGMLLSLALLPARLDVAVVGFLLFRVFDIWKPPPARLSESLPGGWGVMADDLVAGLYANLAGQVVWRVIIPGALG
jgi:phosphatidylglycerophosphatase A